MRRVREALGMLCNLRNAERWCFRGSVDDWISLMGGRQTLEKQARKYLPHLAKESFFDMM